MDNKNYYANYINGRWCDQCQADTLDIFEKFSGNLMAKISLANKDQIEEVVNSSLVGFKVLNTWSAGRRSSLLYELYAELDKRSEEAIDLIIKESGKPRSYARIEVARSLKTIQEAAIEAKRVGGEVIPIDHGLGEGRSAFTQRFPIGPILCITPFNFPMNLVLHKIAPAIACGCSVIVKPAPQAPLSSLFLADLFSNISSPTGAVNVINCSIENTELMVRDERIRMLSFTGSEKVGWHLKNICGQKKITLELGGNAAVIVDEVSSLRSVAKKIAYGAYLYAGQVCISTQRIYVCKSVREQFEAALIEEIKDLSVGDPNDENTIVGPLIDDLHLKRIQDWIMEAKSNGANILIGGDVNKFNPRILNPTLISNTKSTLKVVTEEIFGPVAILETFENFEHAIDLVNQSRYGLQVGVFTNNLIHMKKAFKSIEVAGVIINDIPGFRMDSMPYGGIKMSGLGREGVKYAIEEMTEPKLLVY